jgi:hypothetical protein
MELADKIKEQMGRARSKYKRREMNKIFLSEKLRENYRKTKA